MLLQRFNELENVDAHDLTVCAILSADFIGDGRFVVSLFQQVENLGSNHIQTEDLPVMDVQDDGPILGRCASNSVGDSKHA